MPDWLEAIRTRLEGSGLGPAEEADVAEELAQHLEDRYEELRSRGIAPDQAQRTALEELTAGGELGSLVRAARPRGRPEPVAVGARVGRGRLASVTGDLRFGARLLRRNPGFAAMAVFTLALGIGPNTAIFSVVHAVVFRPLPFQSPDRLVQVWERNAELDFATENIPTSAVNFTQWRAAARTLESLGAFQFTSVTRAGADEPEQHWTVRVTPGLFSGVLGVSPALGRDFVALEGEPGGNDVALISHALWQRRFGGDRSTLGQSMLLDGRAHTIVGIMPRHFRFPMPTMFPVLRRASVDIWLPYAVDAADHPYARNLGVVGRVVAGASVGAAQDELNATHAARDAGWTVRVIPLARQITGEVSTALLVLLGAVSLVLLIACANVANLLLARAAARRREVTVRFALGASRSRLVRQLMTEAGLLALLGGALGLLLAYVVLHAIIAVLPPAFPRTAEIAVNGEVVVFALLVSFVTTLLFAGVPALSATRRDAAEVLRDAGRGMHGRRARRAADSLVAIQVALAIVLLIGGGLLVRSLARLHRIELGFRPERVITGILSLPESAYPNDASRAGFFRAVLERVRALPGVESAAVSSIVPFSGGEEFNGFAIEGRPEPAPAGYEPNARLYQSDPAYFRTLGMTLLRGRILEQADRADAPPAVVINAVAAETYWPGEDPIGQRISFGGGPWFSVVGIVGDIRFSTLDATPLPEVYVSHEQVPFRAGYLVVRTRVDPISVAPALRAAVADEDPGRALADIRTMDQMIGESVAERRLHVLLLVGFAVLALALAAIGLYGVVSQAVTQRTQEIGVRMAMGARPRDVLRLVLRQAMSVVGVGTVARIAAAVALGRLLRSMLFEISSTDPVTFIVVTAVLAAVALVASYVPAQWATRVDPAIALREG